MPVLRTDRLYHYLLAGESHLDSILTQGLLPLSDLPQSDRQRDLAEFYRGLYIALAEPLLKRPYVNSGVFLTPIDFWCLSDSLLARRNRIAIPLEAVDLTRAVLTYESDGERVVLPCTREHLIATQQQWDELRVRDWFGRDRSMLFFHVPQVAAYQVGGIRIDQAWVERPA